MEFYTIKEISEKESIPLRTLNARALALGFEKKANTYFLNDEQVKKLLNPSLHKRGKRAKKITYKTGIYLMEGSLSICHDDFILKNYAKQEVKKEELFFFLKERLNNFISFLSETTFVKNPVLDNHFIFVQKSLLESIEKQLISDNWHKDEISVGMSFNVFLLNNKYEMFFENNFTHVELKYKKDIGIIRTLTIYIKIEKDPLI